MHSHRPEHARAADSGRAMRSAPLQIVVVDSSFGRDASFGRYDDFVAAAQAGLIGLHFCVDGRSAVRLARRFRADVWLVSTELDDMTGFDLLEMIAPHVVQSPGDRMASGAAASAAGGTGGGVAHSGMFLVADGYSAADEQRALATGVAGYLVRPVTWDVIRTAKAARLLPLQQHSADRISD